MARVGTLRRAVSLASVALAVAAGVAVWWAASGAPEKSTLPASSHLTVSPGEVTVAPDASCDLDLAAPTIGKPCKPCKDRPWCGCTYNGAPRISCNPCCYDTQPYPTCYD